MRTLVLPGGAYDPDTSLLHGPRGARALTPAMHAILVTLHKQRGQLVSRETLAKAIWRRGKRPALALHIVAVRVHNIRQRMRAAGLDAAMIVNRREAGYFLAPARLLAALRNGDRRQRAA